MNFKRAGNFRLNRNRVHFNFSQIRLNRDRVCRLALQKMEPTFGQAFEDEFRAFEADYSICESAEQAISSDSEEEETPESLECESQPCPTDTLSVEQNDETIIERALVRKFDNDTCSCSLGHKKTACSAQFTVEEVTEQREHCHTLERSELDLVVLSQLMALGKDVPSQSTEDPMRSKYVEFYFKGKRICRVTFLFLYTLSLKCYRNLLQHVCHNGIVPRVHGNYHKVPHNRIPFDDIQAIVTYLRNLATTHAISLPGRVPGHKDKALLLPSHMSKRSVYRQYMEACSVDGRRCLSWATFQSLWSKLVPEISAIKPATDLCLLCQQNVASIVKSANLPENEKSEKLKNAETHLSLAKLQRTYYNEACSEAKTSYEIYKNEVTGSASVYGGPMHYSFDYAQNVHYPSNPQQPGPSYFKSLRRCGIFGVTCEPLGFQVNYLVDEDDEVGKGANATVSLLDHFLYEHGIGEQHLSLQADNCVGKNKNNVFMQYLLWRVMTGKNKTITISFMMVGHTKFAPDRFFGLIKKRFRHSAVFSLKDMVEVVKSSTVGGCNVPQLTKGLNGQRLVVWRDWKTLLANNFQHIPKITSYHHFRFDSEYPTAVYLGHLVPAHARARNHKFT